MHTRQASGHRRSGSMYGQDLNLGAGDSSSFTNQSPSSKDIPYPFPTEEPDHIGPEVQIGTFGNLLRVAVALLHSDYEHEYRAGLKLISRINSIIPLRFIVNNMLKTTSINPSEGIQQMFWKGLAREKDVNCDDTPLDDVVFQILVETLPSAEVFNNFGLPIQL